MDTQAAFGFKELFVFVIADIAKSLCDRNGETREQQFARSQAVTHMILGFRPQDVIEAMIAGHCVMFHEAIVDNIPGVMRGEPDATRRATRSGIVAMDKAFGNNLARLEHYQTRSALGRRDEPAALPEETLAETDIADRVQRHAAEAAARKPATVPEENNARPSYPSPEAMAACKANPAALAAIEAGDAESFARAMGIAEPSKAFLAAAADKGSVFEQQAVRNRDGARKAATG